MELGEIFGVPTLDRPTVPSLARELLRKKLVESEVAEFSSHFPIDTAPEIESLAAWLMILETSFTLSWVLLVNMGSLSILFGTSSKLPT